ncbi:heme oxygenase [Devosia enhydra]|uniref:Heme oxygenase n=1 Tax=Devosia enhydra TaxID=665118 RepID=A0A1K2HY00_9HYPH|nr:biliverdin-producing heme oxygenase [Devosia enhydra]SFZ84711.1 heme oxygenase [Devosia enhydra]
MAETLMPEAMARAGLAVRGGLAARLKAGTRIGHERLDQRIMAGRPFADRERYGRFLAVQADVLGRASPLYHRADLGLLLPGLAGRDRLDLLEHDLADLGRVRDEAVPLKADMPLPEALGWLYVTEGSTLGAAVLLKAARVLKLSEIFGARHLAGPPQGRGAAWKAFVEALDSVPLSAAEEQRAIAAALRAFAYAHERVEAHF